MASLFPISPLSASNNRSPQSSRDYANSWSRVEVAKTRQEPSKALMISTNIHNGQVQMSSSLKSIEVDQDHSFINLTLHSDLDNHTPPGNYAILDLIKRGEEIPEHLLKLTQSVTALHLCDENLSNANMSQIFKLFINLESLTMPEMAGDDCLTGIEELKKLRELSISFSKITDSGMSEIAKLKTLEILNLDNSKITNGGLADLFTLSSLKELYLSNTKVTCSGVKICELFPSIQRLDLSNTNVSDSGLREVAKCLYPTYLKLRNISLTEEGIEYISKIRTLQKLDLCHNQIPGEGLIVLMDVQNLRWIGLRDTTIFLSEKNVDRISEIKRFILSFSGISNPDGSDIREYLQNENIKFILPESFSPTSESSEMVDGEEVDSPNGMMDFGSEVEDLDETYEIIRLIQGGKEVPLSLRLHAEEEVELDLRNERELTENNLFQIVRLFENLKSLSMPPHTNKQFLRIISKLQDLDILDLGETAIVDGDLYEIVDFHLETIRLHGTSITDAGLWHISKIRTLKSLNLSNTLISDYGLLFIARIKTLKRVILNETNVTDLGLRIFHDHFEMVENFLIVEVRSCKITERGAKKTGFFYNSSEKISMNSFPLSDYWLIKFKNSTQNKSLVDSVARLAIDKLPEPRKFKHKGNNVDEVENLYELNKSIAELILAYDFDPTNTIIELVKNKIAIPKYLRSLALHVTTLDVSKVKDLTNAHMLHLSELFKNLRSLTASTDTNDFFLISISTFLNLVDLDLSETDISDVGLSELVNLPNLKNLNVGTCGVTNLGLKTISGIQTIEVLKLSSMTISSEGFDAISELSNLKCLNLCRCKVNGQLAKSMKFQSLEYINLSDVEDIDTFLGAITGIKSLKRLKLHKSYVTDESLNIISEIKSLTELDLRYTKISDEGLRKLSKLSNLSKLNLEGCNITETGVEMAGLSNVVVYGEM